MANYIDEFRDSKLAGKMATLVSSYKGEDITIMEVCGTHTMALSRFGIRSLLPDKIRLVSGPGCPVCVTPVSFINSALELSKRPGVIITTFGDMMRVPGSNSSLMQEKAKGRDIRVVYSPLDALKIAQENPEKSVVFLSIGFETTTPGIALTIKRAYDMNIGNFSVLTANKTMPEALSHLAADNENRINAFLYPGNVSAIIGLKPYEKLAEKYGVSGAVTGFEPLDLMYSLVYLIQAFKEHKAVLYNQYSRVVKPEGNPVALGIMREVFEPCDARWRGLGNIPGSGLRIREKYKKFDANNIFELSQEDDREPEGCRCGDILKGRATPGECRLFKTACTPDNPVGACMVSSEGTCAAYYRYGGAHV